ncbi:MAG TPA: hypothetical protein VNT56_02525 [Acidimicrobiales bacterium]|nr:hypothetical protein [Acidimicrobiales bacterium]
MAPGTWRLDGHLEPLDGEILDTALRLAGEGPAPAEGEPRRSASERRSEALVDICRFFLEQRSHPGASRHRPHVNVVVEVSDLEQTKGGAVPRRGGPRRGLAGLAGLRLGAAPGHGGRLGRLGLRHLHPHSAGQPVQRPGGP